MSPVTAPGTRYLQSTAWEPDVSTIARLRPSVSLHPLGLSPDTHTGQHRHCTYTWHWEFSWFLFWSWVTEINCPGLHHVSSDWAAPGDPAYSPACSAACLVSITASLSQMKNECLRELTCRSEYTSYFIYLFYRTRQREWEKHRQFPLKIITKIPCKLLGKPCGLGFVLLTGMKKPLWQNGEFNNR